MGLGLDITDLYYYAWRLFAVTFQKSITLWISNYITITVTTYSQLVLNAGLEHLSVMNILLIYTN